MLKFTTFLLSVAAVALGATSAQAAPGTVTSTANDFYTAQRNVPAGSTVVKAAGVRDAAASVAAAVAPGCATAAVGAARPAGALTSSATCFSKRLRWVSRS